MKPRTAVIAWAVLSLAGTGWSQPQKAVSARADSVKTAPRNFPKSAKSGKVNEIILDDIAIKGEVEKPSVIILPKRLEPEMNEVDLERSFKREVKEGAGDVPKPDKALGQVEPVKSIKKTIEKKRE
jgi:hypothetical protein